MSDHCILRFLIPFRVSHLRAQSCIHDRAMFDDVVRLHARVLVAKEQVHPERHEIVSP